MANGQEPLSTQEQAQRQEQFIKEVKKRRLMLRKAKQYSQKERLEAARWLGDSGDPEAILELSVVYQKDTTPGMKQAAAEALGKMRALQEALEDPARQEATMQHINDLVIYGESRSGGDRLGTLRRILGVSFILLLLVALGLNVALEDSAQREAAAAEATSTALAALATSTPSSAEETSAVLGDYFSLLSQDISALRLQFGRISRGESYSCALELNAPAPLRTPNPSEDGERLIEIAEQLNGIEATLRPIREQYEAVCADETLALSREDGRTLDDALVELQAELVTISEGLGDVVAFDTPTPMPTATATEPPTDTPVPTDTPQPTADSSIVRPIALELDDIISEMTGLRGKSELIRSYWNDFNLTGESAGCLQPEPIIPENVELDDALRAQAPTLAEAVDFVNLGLDLTREATTAFFTACVRGDVSDAAARVEQMDVALQAFVDAQTRVDTLLAR